MIRDRPLGKLLTAACERWGKNMRECRFICDGVRFQPEDSPDKVCLPKPFYCILVTNKLIRIYSSKWTTTTSSRCSQSRSVAVFDSILFKSLGFNPFLLVLHSRFGTSACSLSTYRGIYKSKR